MDYFLPEDKPKRGWTSKELEEAINNTNPLASQYDVAPSPVPAPPVPEASPTSEYDSTRTTPHWVLNYKKYRKPLTSEAWQWTPESRPGRYCDIHLLDYMQCLDETNDKLAPHDPPEKFCGAAHEMTKACMIQTLCEQKVFAVTDKCHQNQSPNRRTYDCWYRIWLAQNCADHANSLLTRAFWSSRPDAVSISERYFILLGAKSVPGRPPLPAHYLERRRDFIQSKLAGYDFKPTDIPYQRH